MEFYGKEIVVGEDKCISCEAGEDRYRRLRDVQWDDFPVNSPVVAALRTYADALLVDTHPKICTKCSNNLKQTGVCTQCMSLVHRYQVCTLNRCGFSKTKFLCVVCGQKNDTRGVCDQCSVRDYVCKMRKTHDTNHNGTSVGGSKSAERTYVCSSCDKGTRVILKCTCCHRTYASVGGSKSAERTYVCSTCDKDTRYILKCTCCHRTYAEKDMLLLNIELYDIEDYIVKAALHDRLRCKNGEREHICKKCHASLAGSSHVLPKMPRCAAAQRCDGPGEAFQRAIRQKPEFVCTCCHRWRFRKSVLRYDPSKYNFDNRMVQMALADEMRYKMNVKVYKGEWCAHIHTVPYDIYEVDVNEMNKACEAREAIEKPTELHGIAEYDTIIMEYICDTCHMHLSRKRPVMPPMSCANGLMLDDIPPELNDLTELERRVISLRIPFMSIFCMKRFGSHKKIQGGCTNVPTRLGQIAQMLPRMSSEVQYHPMMIKRKMAYKRNYMYNYMRKDVIMKALQWLLDNNEKYKHIIKNEDWFSEWQESDLSDLLLTSGDKDCTYDDQHMPGGTDGDICSDDNSDDMKNGGYDDATIAEIEEDIQANEKSERLHGIPDATVLEPEVLESEIYACAPGENMTPKYMLLDEHFEELAFPDMFPFGHGGYNTATVRYSKLTLRQYFQQRLLNVDGRFGKGVEYLFCAQFGAEVKQLQGSTYVALRLKRGKTLDGRTVTAGMLRRDNEIKRLARHDELYKMLKNVRGSPPYWQHQMFELLAMLRALGKPTFFMTLSAADMYWREMLEATAIWKHEPYSNETIRRMSLSERAKRLKASPTLAAWMFLYRVETFMETYVKHVSNPLGKVTDFVFKIEFQMRGAPHAHCLLWVEGAPQIDVDSDEDVVSFIDKYVCGEIPSKGDNVELLSGMVQDFQCHKHSKSCRRNRRCRFDFPKPPCPRTLIARECTEECDSKKKLQHASDILTQVSEAINDGGSLDEVLARARVPEQTYIDAISLCRSGRKVVLRRQPRDSNVNNYNAGLLRYWGANVDLQYVLDEYSTIMYVSSYMMKSEKEMGEVLKTVSKECASQPIKEQLKNIGKAFLGTRVVGAPEAAMRLMSLPLIRKTREMRYVDANRRDYRVSLPKPRYQLDRMDDDDPDIYMKSWHDRYSRRPNTLEDMCFARFCAKYDPVYKYRNISLEEEDPHCEPTNVQSGEDDARKNTITLKDNAGVMRKRRKEAIPLVKQYKEASDSEAYYHSRIILYKPWRNEDELLGNFKTYGEHYREVQDEVEKNAQYFQLHSEKIQAAWDTFQNSAPPESVWDTMAPAARQEDADASENGTRMYMDSCVDPSEQGNDVSVNSEDREKQSNSEKHSLTQMYGRIARKDIFEPAHYRALVRSLNREQRQIVMFNRHWCKQYIRAIRNKCELDGYKVFLSGSGGAGKSYVIQLIRHDVVYLLQQILMPDPEQPLAMVTAPTGTAAFTIDGTTLHSAFQLAVGNVRKHTASLDRIREHIMRDKLQLLQLLVIDEISMVGNTTFQEVSIKLGEIKQKKHLDWGGVCVLAVGDLMQLNPIGQTTVYRNPYVTTPGDLAPLLWDDFLFHELKQVMRQRDGAFAAMLNKIRMEVPMEGSPEDQMLRSRRISIANTHDDYPHDVIHIYAQNAHCDMWNNTRLDQLPGACIQCYARDQTKDTSLLNHRFPTNPHLTGNLHHCVQLKIGARVMLTTNVDVSDGLTNGAMGKVVHVPNVDGYAKVVLVQFDNSKVGAHARAMSTYYNYPSAVPIARVEVSFAIRGRKYIRVSRTQFPLMLAWAVTIHKIQGATLQSVVVDMDISKGRFQVGQAYVAFSRVKKLEDLHIVNYDRRQIIVNEKAVLEMKREGKDILPDVSGPYMCNEITEERLDMHSLDMHNNLPPAAEAMVSDHRASKYLKLCYLNIRHLTSKLPDVAATHEFGKHDVLCFAETKLGASEQLYGSQLGIPAKKYICYRCDRDRSGGGVMMLVHMDLLPQRIYIGKLQNFEYVMASVAVGLQMAYICALYRSPVSNIATWLANMTKILEYCNGCRLYIIGDLNEDLLHADSARQHPIHGHLLKQGLQQHVRCPTTDRGALLDHFYTCNVPTDAVHVDVMDCYYSDHDMLSCVISVAGESLPVLQSHKQANTLDGHLCTYAGLTNKRKLIDDGLSYTTKSKKLCRDKVTQQKKDRACAGSTSQSQSTGEVHKDVAGEPTLPQRDIVLVGMTGADIRPYAPLTVNERDAICTKYSLFVGVPQALTFLPHTNVHGPCNGPPTKTKQIYGDGNCLFRAVSYLLCGSQDSHALLRAFVCDYIVDPDSWDKMRAYCSSFHTGALYDNGAMYVEQEQMDVLGTWGTHVEIFALAQMTGKDIEVYTGHEWRRHCATGSRTNVTDTALYLDHVNHMHYNAVLGV